VAHVVGNPQGLLPGGELDVGGQAQVERPLRRTGIEGAELVRVENNVFVRRFAPVARFDPVSHDPGHQFLLVGKLGF